jgi:hypothetical protein
MTEALAAFGLDATVTPPGGAAVEMRAMWLAGSTPLVPAGGDFRRAEQKRILVLPVNADLPAIPRGTMVSMPDEGQADPQEWLVDSTLSDEFDHRRVAVVPA